MTASSPVCSWPLALCREEATYRGSFALVEGNLASLAELRPLFLSPAEADRLAGIPSERRRFSFLGGRIAAKAALQVLESDVLPGTVTISEGVFTQPVVRAPGLAGWQVSISHTTGVAGAIAFPEEHPMGLDIESVRPESDATIRTQLTARDLGLHGGLPFAASTGFALMWAMKESLSKVLKCGLMSPFSMLELASVDSAGPVCVGTFSNFSQYKVLARVRGSVVVAVTLPKRTELDLAFLTPAAAAGGLTASGPLL